LHLCTFAPLHLYAFTHLRIYTAAQRASQPCSQPSYLHSARRCVRSPALLPLGPLAPPLTFIHSLFRRTDCELNASSCLLVLRSLRLLWALTSRSHHTHALHRPPESAVGRILAPATHRPAVLPYCDESGRDSTAQSSSSGSRRLLLDRGLATPREFEVRGSRFEVRGSSADSVGRTAVGVGE
jgi:hypothetical protein